MLPKPAKQSRIRTVWDRCKLQILGIGVSGLAAGVGVFDALNSGVLDAAGNLSGAGLLSISAVGVGLLFTLSVYPFMPKFLWFDNVGDFQGFFLCGGFVGFCGASSNASLAASNSDVAGLFAAFAAAAALSSAPLYEGMRRSFIRCDAAEKPLCG